MDILLFIAFFTIVIASIAYKLTMFRRHKADVASATVDTGLHFEDLGGKTRVWGTVGGHQIQVETEHRGKWTKHEHIHVSGVLKLTNAPDGLTITAEGVDSGFKRLGNQSEIEFDHLDFDNAFWVTSDDPQRALEYLDKDKRDGLLHWMFRLGSGSIKDGVLSKVGHQSEVRDAVGPMLSQFIGLAKAFSGESHYHQSTSALPEGWVVTEKLNLLGFVSGLLAFVFWLLPLEVHLPDFLVTADHVLMGLSALACLLAIWGQRTAVVVIAGLLALMTSAALVLVTLALVADKLYIAAVIPACIAGVWSILWCGSLIHLWSLKMKPR